MGQGVEQNVICEGSKPDFGWNYAWEHVNVMDAMNYNNCR